MRLILIRHGQTSSNVRDLLDTGAPGADLTALGREQAAAVPGSLADEDIDVIYASNLVRTQQTAVPLLEERRMDLLVRPGLREISAGDIEMRDDEVAHRAYLGAIFGWATDPHGRVPGAESGYEVWQRYDEIVAEAHGAGATTAVMFSHGAVIRSWCAARVENITGERAARNPLTNTGAIVLEGSPREGWWAHAWEGQPLGGERLATPGVDGPGGEPAPGVSLGGSTQ